MVKASRGGGRPRGDVLYAVAVTAVIVFCVCSQTKLMNCDATSLVSNSVQGFAPPATEAVASGPQKKANNNIPIEYSKDNDNGEWWKAMQPLLKDWPRLEARADIHPWLEKLGYKRGIEVGVQRGSLARKTLKSWPSCEEYKLVDLWGQDPFYTEPGRDTNDVKNGHLANARRILKTWTNKGITEFFVMRSVDAASKIKDSYFDYIYIDARHDFCAVTEDIAAYWPKLRPGGIMAGHDFIDAASAMKVLGPQEDWSKCEDGSVQPRAVKGAVEDFAAKNNLQIVTTHEGFDTWLMQKPYASA